MQSSIHSLFQVAEVELVYKNKTSRHDKIKIGDATQAYQTLLSAWDMNKIELLEQFAILLLDRANHCLGMSVISTGGVSGCIADPKIIFATALKSRASSIILAHNHPSGNLQPSRADVLLTERLVAAGKLLELSVIDHLILAPAEFYSFADHGLIYS